MIVETREGAQNRRGQAVVFLLRTYQQEHWVAESLASALAQDYSNLTVLVTDDASTDRTPDVIAKVIAGYDGPHAITFARQPQNLRIHHYNAVMPEFIKAAFVVSGGGDDVFHPDRVRRSVETMITQNTFAATCNGVVMDAQGAGDELFFDPDGKYDLSLEGICRTVTNRACHGAGLSWRREVFTRFGKLRPGPRQADQLIVFRALLLGGISLIREPLFRYRQHDANTSLARMAEVADAERRPLVEERRRANVLATLVAQRELLHMARDKALRPLDYLGLDAILMDSICDRARKYTLFRAQLADQGVGIY